MEKNREVIGLQFFFSFPENPPNKEQWKYTASNISFGAGLTFGRKKSNKAINLIYIYIHIKHSSHIIFVFVFKQELCGSGKGYTDLSLLCSPVPVLPQALSENEPTGLIQTPAHVSPHCKTPENLARSAVSAQERPRTAIAEVLEIRTREHWLSYVGKQNIRSLTFIGTGFTCTK